MHAIQNENSNMLAVYGCAPDSIVDGPGLRYAIFFQGCSHHCKGCHNPDSQPFSGGDLLSVDDILADIKNNGLVHNITLSGGEPFEQPAILVNLLTKLKQENYGVWVYSGYTYEELLRFAYCEEGSADFETRSKLHPHFQAETARALLENCDVLVDGPFIEAEKSLGLQWKGSANQRVIDLAKTRQAGSIVLFEEHFEVPPKPDNW